MSQWNAQWDDWASILAREVADLPWGWFLIIEYAPIRPCPIGPYAQVSRYPQGSTAKQSVRTCPVTSESSILQHSRPMDGTHPTRPRTTGGALATMWSGVLRS